MKYDVFLSCQSHFEKYADENKHGKVMDILAVVLLEKISAGLNLMPTSRRVN